MLNAINRILSSPKPPGADAKSNPTGAAEDPSGAFCIDEYRPMRIAVIGAGASGIIAAIRFRQYIPNLQLTVYEQMDGIGGTWYANRYPGVACDIPSHCYQFSFEQKHDWSSMYAPGSEILAYMQDVVKKYKLEPYIKLRHELTGARYDESTGKWTIRLKCPSESSPADFEEMDDWADFVFNGIGVLNRWKWPDITGLKDFKGTMVHSANWDLGGTSWEDDVKDWGDKKVGVIGLGSSAMQIVGALGPKVGKLHNFARAKTWIAPPFMTNVYQKWLSREVDGSNPDTFLLSEKEQKLVEDPDRLMKLRRELEQQINGLHKITFRDSPEQEYAKKAFKEHMFKSLVTKPELAEKLLPNYSVCCRRLTPAPGFLNAMCAENYDLVTTNIRQITHDGIETEDGKRIDLDVIICATGFDTSYQLPFPIVGRNQIDLKDKWTPDPTTYLSVCTDGFPNMFFSNGPNSATGTSGLLLMMEHQIQYAVTCAMKLQRERLKSIEPKIEAIADFEKVMQDYFKKTVFAEPVKSWYKPGGPDGRVVGVWPGSALHEYRALRYPRWEDFNFESLDNTSNRFFWFGNGMTHAENSQDEDRTWYLAADYVDIPPSEPKDEKSIGRRV